MTSSAIRECVAEGFIAGWVHARRTLAPRLLTFFRGPPTPLLYNIRMLSCVRSAPGGPTLSLSELSGIEFSALFGAAHRCRGRNRKTRSASTAAALNAEEVLELLPHHSRISIDA